MDRREKTRATYQLRSVQEQMTNVDEMNLTLSAKKGIYAAGMSDDDALEVIRSLRPSDFYKSMPCDGDHTVWQDVYFACWDEIDLYIKICKRKNYFVISFKESENT